MTDPAAIARLEALLDATPDDVPPALTDAMVTALPSLLADSRALREARELLAAALAPLHRAADAAYWENDDEGREARRIKNITGKITVLLAKHPETP